MKVKVYDMGLREFIIDISDKYRVIVRNDPCYNDTVACSDAYWDLMDELEAEVREKMPYRHIAVVRTLDDSQMLYEE